MRRAVLPLLAALLAAPFQPAAAPAFAAPPAAERIEGEDRFATAAAVAARLAPGPGGAVVLATGTDYADALAAGPVAARLGAPVLLAAGASLPEPTRSAIERQRPERIVVVGSERAVSAEAEAELRALVPEAAIERHGGRDRHETAALLARAFFPGAREVFVATGWNYPDALSAAAAAAVRGAPVLLGTSEWLTEPSWRAIEDLGVEHYWLVGGRNVLEPDLPPKPVADVASERIAGADRFATNAAVVDRFFPGPAAQAFVATGSDYPDALVAAPLAAAQGAPLLLSRRDCAPEPVDASVARLLAGAGDGGLRITAIGRAVEAEAALRSCAA